MTPFNPNDGQKYQAEWLEKVLGWDIASPDLWIIPGKAGLYSLPPLDGNFMLTVMEEMRQRGYLISVILRLVGYEISTYIRGTNTFADVSPSHLEASAVPAAVLYAVLAALEQKR